MGRIAILSLAALAAACNPFAFDDFEDEAGVVALEPPDGYPKRNYGIVLAAYAGPIDGAPESRVVASGGTDTPIVAYRGWAGDGVGLSGALYEVCDDEGDCGDGSGAALVGVPRWRPGSPAEGTLCLLATAPTSGEYVVRCEGGAAASERFNGPDAERFGAAAAPLPEGSPFGVALIGAPDAAGGAGALYRAPDASGPVPLGLPASTVPAGAGLGSAIATAETAGGDTLVAVGAPAAGRVLVLVLVDDGMGGVSAEVRACLDGDGGHGGSLAWGDVDGDGAPELFVGARAGAENRRDAVDLFPGTGLPTTPTTDCASANWTEAPSELGCPGGVRDGLVSCGANGGFGSALAVGDVNADGTADLIVGAPLTAVDGVERAGAVFVFPGGPDGLDPAAADVLTHSSPEDGDEVGVSVAAMPSHLGPGRTPRSEVIAGAPGRPALLAFLCSGLEGDTPAVGTRCIVGQ